MGLQIHTIGHSTRSAEEFRDLLAESGIRKLVDIRQYPGSRRVPHFNREALAEDMARAGIDYEWMRELGGRRRGAAGPSLNPGLRNASFRNYADYMQTAEFQTAVERLLQRADEKPCAIMCAEAAYWRCHRRLVSDFLTARGVEVRHIMGRSQVRPHALTEGAVIQNASVTYPGPKGSDQQMLWK